jgi:flagellar basal-body rod modification protein FlgD
MTIAPTTAANSALSQLASSANPSTSTTSGASASSTANTLNQLTTDFNNFLTLLTTQLKNQDPLSPMDSTQFTQQLVAFTGVEAQINGNAKLDELISLNKTDQLTASANFVGNQIEATSSQAWLDPNGTASQIGYTLPSQAAAVLVQIQDSAGNIVRHIQGTANKGHNVVTWDGNNDQGTAMPSGVYTVSVQGIDQNQVPIKGITQSIIGTVTNISTDPTNGTELSIGNVTVPLTAVTSIKKAA